MADPGLRPWIADVKVGLDDRGLFVPYSSAISADLRLHSFRPNDPARPDLLVQVPAVRRAYFVKNFARGTIRGFHLHEREWKFFAMALGAAKFALIGEMEWNGGELYTYGDVETFVLSDAKPQLMVVPPGWANGWMSLTEECILLALSSATFEESVDDDKRFDPMRVEHVWRVKPR